LCKIIYKFGLGLLEVVRRMQLVAFTIKIGFKVFKEEKMIKSYFKYWIS